MGKCLKFIPVIALIVMLAFSNTVKASENVPDYAGGEATMKISMDSGKEDAIDNGADTNTSEDTGVTGKSGDNMYYDADTLDATATGTHIASYSVNDATWDWENKTWNLRSYTMDGAEAFCVQFGTDMAQGDDAYWYSSVDSSEGAKNIARVKFFTDKYGATLYGLDSIQRTWVVQRYCWESGYNINSGSNTWRLNYDNGYTDSIFDELVGFALNMNSTGSVEIFVAGVGVQDLGVISYQSGNVELVKGEKVGDYSLAGALYKIYNTSGKWTGITMITDADGQGYLAVKNDTEPESDMKAYDSTLKCWWKATDISSVSLAPGNYTTKEVEKPKSNAYLLNENAINFNVAADTAGTVSCTEEANVADVIIRKKAEGNSEFLAQLMGNRMYSQDFSGAEFTLTFDGQTMSTVTTAGGTAELSDLIIGSSLIITETKAPFGFMLPDEGQTGTVGDPEFTFVDIPAMAVNPFKIIKCREWNGQADKTSEIKGVIFKIQYYDCPLEDVEGDCALRTWYFESDANGEIYYGSSWLSPDYESDPLYFNIEGEPAMPLGAVLVTEIRCDDEYKLWSGRLAGEVSQKNNGCEAAFAWVRAENETDEAGESFGSLDSTYLANVANAMQIAMPLTGGEGLWPVILGAIGLMAGALGLVQLLKRKNVFRLIGVLVIVLAAMLASGTLLLRTEADDNIKQELPTIIKEVDKDDACAGELLNYTLSCTLPDNYEKFSTYELIITDIWEEGITLDEGSLMVKDSMKKDITEAAEITWNSSSFYVRFANLKEVVTEGRTITITYQGMLNTRATTGQNSNDNSAYITYTKSPGSPELAKSKESVARVFSWRVETRIVSTDGRIIETSFTARNEEDFYINADGALTPDRRKTSIWKTDANSSFALPQVGSGTLNVEEITIGGNYAGVGWYQLKITSDVSNIERIFLEASTSGGTATVEAVDADAGIIKVLIIVSSFPVTGDRTDTLLLVVTMMVALLCVAICIAGIAVNRKDSKIKKRNEKSSELWKRRIN